MFLEFIQTSSQLKASHIVTLKTLWSSMSLTTLINRRKGLPPNPTQYSASSHAAPPKLPTLRLNASGHVKQKNKTKSKRPEPKPKEDGLADDFVEDHLILRLPQEQANRLRSTLRRGEAPSDLSLYFYGARLSDCDESAWAYQQCLIYG